MNDIVGKRSNPFIGAIGMHLLAYAVTFIVMLPFLWMILLSFKTNDGILNEPFTLDAKSGQLHSRLVNVKDGNVVR
ncbi:hypothetical protein LJK87_23865 [Paenibacillus sp. P25]|nr:hypothetical protein LJK87_23865 [Paenibacillus sp. P25]